MPGSGALRGRGSKLVVLLVLGVLVLSLVPPLVIENFSAWGVQKALDTTEKIDVEVYSTFPPMMLLGRIDSVKVTGLPHPTYKVRAEGVSVSVPSLIALNPKIVAESCSPAINENIDQIHNYIALDCQSVGE